MGDEVPVTDHAESLKKKWGMGPEDLQRRVRGRVMGDEGSDGDA
jgi:hypothetical protein